MSASSAADWLVQLLLRSPQYCYSSAVVKHLSSTAGSSQSADSFAAAASRLMGNPHETAARASLFYAAAAAVAVVAIAAAVVVVAAVEAASAVVVGKCLHQEPWVGPWTPSRCAATDSCLLGSSPVSYTHLTLPTIYSV